jgi:hypothetical protein
VNRDQSVPVEFEWRQFAIGTLDPHACDEPGLLRLLIEAMWQQSERTVAG